MIDYELCKECGACQAICPVEAIKLNKNNFGFMEPVVDKEKCISCHLCDKICYQTRNIFNTTDNQVCYAARAENLEYSSTSRSGGGYRMLSDYMIKQYNAVIYGASLNGTEVIHERIVDADKLINLSGSKYVWSEHITCLKSVETDLKEGKHVVFSGLPCQVAALISYLKAKSTSTQNLLTCDIVCHGCPSNKLYKDYLIYQEKKHKTRIESIDFRNKRDFGWKTHIETLYTKKGMIHSDVWVRIFYSHLGLRNSCFDCEYKRKERVGDISLGDCWNIEKTDSIFNDDKGTSLILVNTDKGNRIMEEIKHFFILKNIDIHNYMQPALRQSVEKPSRYDEFWKSYVLNGFEYVLKEFVRYGVNRKVRFFFKFVYYRVNKIISNRIFK